MKYLIIALLFGCVFAGPRHAILPRLQSLTLHGKTRLLTIGEKIVGGTEVVPNSLPFQISLQRKGILGIGYAHSCGGSIINETTILTAAHCVEGVNDVTIFRVVAGEHNLTEPSGLEQNQDVLAVVLHPRYDYNTLQNDIALLTLVNPLDLSVPSAKPIRMPPPTMDPATGTITTVSGWGYMLDYGTLSEVLLSADLAIVSDDDCNRAHASQFIPNPVIDSMLCAGVSDGSVDACTGDSGGPLFTGTGADTIQHGIVSWGRGCGLVGFPGVYTQVSYFIDWIRGVKP